MSETIHPYHLFNDTTCRCPNVWHDTVCPVEAESAGTYDDHDDQSCQNVWHKGTCPECGCVGN